MDKNDIADVLDSLIRRLNFKGCVAVSDAVQEAAIECGIPIGGGDPRLTARKLIREWCSDHAMWGTHGMPPESKLQRLEDDITRLLSESTVG